MLNKKEAEIAERYINGLANEKEKVLAESLFLNGEDNYSLRQLVEKDWDKMVLDPPQTGMDLNPALDHIHHIILKNEYYKRKKLLHRMSGFYMRAAAILLLPLLTAFLIFIYLNRKTAKEELIFSSLYAPPGSRISFNLPDGTSGMLNSGSRLSYSMPFNNNRKVKLEGEAWLEVNRDEDHPFEISTGNSVVKVLGTSFNISAYPDENYVEVVLQHGKVEFQDNKSNEKIILLPSERLVFRNGAVSKSVTDPVKYNAWTEGKLVFRGDPIAEVGRRIERWYNVKIELADKEIEKYSFRATFEDDKLEEVLRLLSLTSPIRYQITPGKLSEDGTFEKEKVTIYLKK